MTTPLRILIVDDSALMRRLLRELLESDPGLRIVGEAADGRAALALVAELRPDLVILDVRMPVMDGVETTHQIMAYTPTPILILTASLSSYEVDITFQMLGAGALDVMEKPRLGDPVAVEAARQALRRKVRLLSRVKVVTHLRGRRTKSKMQNAELPAGAGSLTPERARRPAQASTSGAAQPAPSAASPVLHAAFPVVVIGASTGGPRVVRQVLAGLPRDFAAAVLVVQHIAQGFSGGMAEWLAASVTLPVDLAGEGAALGPGRVLLAPDRFDLLVQRAGTVHLSGQPLLLQRPAIDITIQSVVAVYGPATAGVLLTGMGRDGAIGMQAVRRAGGLTIAQDAASCTIFGMPRAAIELGAAELVLTPVEIAPALVAWATACAQRRA